MPTSAQIIAALTLSNTFTVLAPSAPKNKMVWVDATDWASISISSGAGDTVKIIALITDPTGTIIYQNTGYAASSFASPDTTLASLTAAAVNLLTYVSDPDLPVLGDYTIALKVQVTPNGQSAIEVEKSFTFTLSESISGIAISLQESYNCLQATYASRDITNYALPGFAITGTTRTHVVTPPIAARQAGQSAVTSASALVSLSAPDNQLWTGTYTAALTTVVTYISGNNTIIATYIGSAEQLVTCDNNYCQLQCCIDTLIDKFTNAVANGNTTEAIRYLKKWQLCSQYLLSIIQCAACNNSTLQQTYTTAFYKAAEPDCSCSCDDCNTESAPVTPTQSIDGAPGADGLSFRTGSGVPDGALGVVGDTYLDYATGNVYQKTGTTTWTFRILITGATGATGASFRQGSGAPAGGLGSNGDSYLNSDNGDVYLKTAGSWAVTFNIKGEPGSVILFNEFPEVASTTNGSYSTFTEGTITVEADTLAATGDELFIRTVIYTAASTGGIAQGARVRFAGSTVADGLYSFGSGPLVMVLETRIVRTEDTVARFETTRAYYNSLSLGVPVGVPLAQSFSQTIDPIDYTVDNDILIQGISVVTGDVTWISSKVLVQKT